MKRLIASTLIFALLSCSKTETPDISKPLTETVQESARPVPNIAGYQVIYRKNIFTYGVTDLAAVGGKLCGGHYPEGCNYYPVIDSIAVSVSGNTLTAKTWFHDAHQQGGKITRLYHDINYLQVDSTVNDNGIHSPFTWTHSITALIGLNNYQVISKDNWGSYGGANKDFIIPIPL